MSRRVPESMATRAWRYEAPLALSGELWDMPEADSGDPEVGGRMAELVRGLCGGVTDEDMRRYGRAYAHGEAPALTSDVVWCARWAHCRQVYRLDPAVAAEVLDQDIEGDIPAEALTRLPFPIVFIDVPIYVVTSVGSAMCPGFLAWVDDGRSSLALSFVRDEARWNTMTVSLSGCETLSDAVDAHIASLVESMADFDAPAEHVEIAGSRAYRDGLTRQVAQALNLLLFVISEEEDAIVTYRPPSGGRGEKVGPRTNLETHRLLGARMGRAIGAAKSACLPAGEPSTTGRTVAPHVRKAHWAHYWVGPRKGRDDGRHGDELILRWVPPTFVNGLGEPVEVVHEARP